MYISIKVAGRSLDELETAKTAALDAFFGTTPYTATMNNVQFEAAEFDEFGVPLRYLGDILAETT